MLIPFPTVPGGHSLLLANASVGEQFTGASVLHSQGHVSRDTKHKRLRWPISTMVLFPNSTRHRGKPGQLCETPDQDLEAVAYGAQSGA